MKWSRTAGLFLGLFLLIITLFLVTGSPSLADTPGVVVSPISGLYTTEAGGTAIFTIVLNTSPLYDVNIVLLSGNTSEGTVSPSVVTFTPANWNTPQTVTVTGKDDAILDDDVLYAIITSAASSSDPTYNNSAVADVSLINSDNDFTLVAFNRTTGLVTSEAGVSASFTMWLTKAPIANVTIGLSSSDAGEGNVSLSNVTFSAANYSTPRTVTTTGQDDSIIDGNIPYVIITAPATSADGNYSNKNAADISVTNADNDVAGITVSPTSGLVTTEAGVTATFNITLKTQPTANVTIGLNSSDITEGTVSPPNVTFSTSNWSTKRMVTVTGQPDAIVDGNQSYTITTLPASSVDTHYNGLNAADVSVVNIDTPGIGVYPTSGLITTEAGGTATFNIVLNTSPSADVTITLTSNDSSEGTVSPSVVTFTTSNWNVPRMVTVTGKNDSVMDGNQLYTIVNSNAYSTDPNYSGLPVADVVITNIDNDQAGITVNPTSGLVTNEAGSTATFTIVLNNRSAYDVSIILTSNDSTEGTVSPSVLTFTNASWNTPRTVTVTGIDDHDYDGDILYTINTSNTVSTDPNYNNLPVADVSVTNIDNDTPGITVYPTSGLITTESAGNTTFSIVLNTKPNASVLINMSSSNTLEGTISTASVTFTTGNWNQSQTVTITGVEDSLYDGNVPYTIVTDPASSADLDYNGKDAVDVSVTNLDNDTAGITVSPTSGLVTTEAGGTATFTIVLASLPMADVTIGLSSNDSSEGIVSPSSVTFSTTNWSTPRTVTITGQDDAVLDGNVSYIIITARASSSDAGYSIIDPPDVSVTNTDNDVAVGITVNPTSGLVTTEAGAATGFTIVLNALPTADVTIGLSSSDTSEGTIYPSSVTFGTTNWSTPRTVTITGVADAIVDGNILYTIVTTTASSGDTRYNGYDVLDVSVTNIDTTACTAPGKPQTPSPGNSSTNQSINLTLGWAASANATSYIVYLSNSTTPAWYGNTSTNSYPASLNYSTLYYWRVVANNSCGTNSSDVWNFTTCAGIPTKPQLSYPGNVSTNISTSVTLNWSVCVNATSYDVYWNTSTTLTYRGNTVNNSYPASLNSSTLYYWRVVANNSCGINSSDVWSFTTAGAAGATPTPTPTPVATPTPVPTMVMHIGGTTATLNTSSSGVVQQAVNVTSADGTINLRIPSGTTALYAEGDPLDRLNMGSITAHPNTSENRQVVAAFDFNPDGATFNPGIQITLKYDPDMLPSGVNASGLVIAFYNDSTDSWEYITNGVVNTVAHTISVTVTHFTVFTIQTPSIHGGGLSIWVIIAIVVASAIVLGVAVGLFFKYRRSRGPAYVEDDEGNAYEEYGGDVDSENKVNEDFKF